MLHSTSRNQNLHARYVIKLRARRKMYSCSPAVKVPLLEQEIDMGSVRSSRNRRNPARFRDFIPTSTVPTQVGRYLTKKRQLEEARARADATRPEQNPEPLLDEGSGEGDSAIMNEANRIITSPDPFGVFRKYSSLSSHNPDDIDPFSDIPSTLSGTISTSRPPAAETIGSNLTVSPAGADSDPFANSDNPTEDLLLSWYSQGSTDGATCLDRLVNCIQDPHFDISQLKDFNAVGALRRFEEKHLGSKSGDTLKPGDGWKCGLVAIRVPCVHHRQREEDAPEFVVDGICYRDATEIIAKELADPDSFNKIHLKAFEEWWRPTETSDPVRVYSEIYTSDAMLELERVLEERLKNSAGPQLETFILAMLLYSDGTRLAQFGHASLWPVYMYIGNISKYIRSQPNSFSAHHVAYLPTVLILIRLSCCTSHSLSPATGHDQRVLLQTLWYIPQRRYDRPPQAGTHPRFVTAGPWRRTRRREEEWPSHGVCR